MQSVARTESVCPGPPRDQILGRWGPVKRSGVCRPPETQFIESAALPASMAWSLRNQCAIEEDFEDEDFLSAVEDVETGFTVSIPTTSRGLRPISSGLQSLCRSTSHQESKEWTSNYVNQQSPALSCQSSFRQAAEATLPQRSISCLRPIGHEQVPAAPSVSLSSPREGLSSGCRFSAASTRSTSIHGNDNQPNHSSAAGFSFVSQPSSVGDSPDDGFDDDLFLSACKAVELPSPDLDQRNRSLATLVLPRESSTNGPWREQDTSEEPVRKKLCETGQKTDPGSSLQEAQKHNTNAVLLNLPGLSLRPSSVSVRHQLCPPRTSCPVLVAPNVSQCSSIGKSVGTISSYQKNRAISGSTRPSEEGIRIGHQASASYSSMTSPDQRTLRLPKSAAPVLNFPQLNGPSSTFQQPLGRPQEPCALMTSISSPASCPRIPCVPPGPSTVQPIVTNHLVQLVTAANQTPQGTTRMALRAKTRRFPGPAGILPQQVSGKNLEEILISTPHTPTHGAMARMRTQLATSGHQGFCMGKLSSYFRVRILSEEVKEVSSSQQTVEEEFSKGPWMTMKAEFGLDEKNSACFLHTYSVIMVLRKAALKQLPKNKVPNMAVVLKSIAQANVDASAVFKDPTGEMQGTLHHLLLEEREGELKAGSVLLLQQVGVFSPSSRSHYLNVTPNNVVKIYPHDKGDDTGQSLEQQDAQNPIPFSLDSPQIGASASNSHGQRLRRNLQNDLNSNDEPEPPGTSMAFVNNTLLETRILPAGPKENSATTTEWDMDDLDSIMEELPEDSLMEGGSHQ